MTVSMRVMSAGDGYRYLLRSVAQGDGDISATDRLTRYYTKAGTPPGRWLGRGVGEFGDGALKPGDTVTETQLKRLLGTGRDPLTAMPLGREYQNHPSVPERINARVEKLDLALTPEQRATEVARIEAEETKAGSRTAVAGFDLTFSVPKSVSVLWGLADATTQTLIADAHHAAVEEVVDLLERHVAATRTGTGGVAQEDVVGVAATAYDHYDSRTHDPQLHTHVVVSNKVRTASDGVWRTLDSRALHRAVVALSEHYNAVLMDRLTGSFGLEWELRWRGEDRTAQWEITGVPEVLIGEFSSRSHAINAVTEELIDDYAAKHGRRPSNRVVIQLRAQATLETRPQKTIRSLADLTSQWRGRAVAHLGEDPTMWAARLTTAAGERVHRADEVPDDDVAQVGAAVVAVVSEKRSTWRHWNLWAEASRQTMGWRFATDADREDVVARVVEAAEERSLSLTPPELATTPDSMRRQDGTSTLRPKHHVVFSAEHVLAGEDRIVARAGDRSAPTIGARTAAHMAGRRDRGQTLTAEQIAAVQQVATSGRRVDVLVGPAGAGKTTTMRALHHAWTRWHGRESVVGLAPSAAAARVLAEDLGMACDNTAKWLHEHDVGRAAFRKDQLVIIDEATLAGTATLDRITALAERAGAKVLLVGDHAQLQSVDAGGTFALLVAERERDDGVPQLTAVHRFRHEWEKAASLALRRGDTDVIGTYSRNGRLRGGTTEAMIDSAYAAWRADVASGKATLLIAEATAVVRELNSRARADRILAGDTSPGRAVTFADGTQASVGDVVITRRNDRRLVTPRGGFVRNGDRWRVTDVRPDGGLEVHRVGRHLGAGAILSAEYVAEHVDLGYAVTAHRAQGMTVDTAHVLVTGTTTRENLYVALTRGRDTNLAYVGLDRPDELHTPPTPNEVTRESVLFGVLQHSGAELSARQTIQVEQDHWGGIAQLAAEYEYIAQEAQRPRWTGLITGALRLGHLSEDGVEAAKASTAFDALAAELRLAEANGHDVEEVLFRAAMARSLLDADDPCAVLHSRVARVAARPARGRNPQLVAGLIPEAEGPMPDDARRALAERAVLIEERARSLAEGATHDHEVWVSRVTGAANPPSGTAPETTDALATVAAYRDRYAITGVDPLGPDADTLVQKRDRDLADAAVHVAQDTTPRTVRRRRSGANERVVTI